MATNLFKCHPSNWYKELKLCKIGGILPGFRVRDGVLINRSGDAERLDILLQRRSSFNKLSRELINSLNLKSDAGIALY